MSKIELKNGYTILVDDEDYDELIKHKWHICKKQHTQYAMSCFVKSMDKSHPLYHKHTKMHRYILGITDPNTYIDHIDGNGLNNHKSNLRVCTNSENQQNYIKKRKSTSCFNGVSYSPKSRIGKRWTCRVSNNKDRILIGYYPTELDAAIARDVYIIKHNLIFYKLNLLKRDAKINY